MYWWLDVAVVAIVVLQLVSLVTRHVSLTHQPPLLSLHRISGKRIGYNNMIYSEDEIVRIARVAGEFKDRF